MGAPSLLLLLVLAALAVGEGTHASSSHMMLHDCSGGRHIRKTQDGDAASAPMLQLGTLSGITAAVAGLIPPRALDRTSAKEVRNPYWFGVGGGLARERERERGDDEDEERRRARNPDRRDRCNHPAASPHKKTNRRQRVHTTVHRSRRSSRRSGARLTGQRPS